MGRKHRLSHKKNSKGKKPHVDSSCASTTSDESLNDEKLTINVQPREVSSTAASTIFLELKSKLSLPNKSWTNHESPLNNNKLLLCKLSEVPSQNTIVILHCLTVYSDATWSLSSTQHPVDPANCSALKHIPSLLTPDFLLQLLHILDHCNLCSGQPDTHFVKMVKAKKGKVLTSNGKISAFVDDCIVIVDGEFIMGTVRSSECEIISLSSCCISCKAYRPNLRSMYSRWSKRRADDIVLTDSSSHTNNRYLLRKRQNHLTLRRD